MKPAAFAATLLLHAAAIGIMIHVGSGTRPSFHSGASLEVMVLSETGAPAGNPSSLTGGDKAVSRPVATARTAPRIRERATDRPPESAAVAISSVAALGHSTGSSASGPTTSAGFALDGGAHSGVSIPASYAASNRKPVYPLLSVKHEEQGTVLLRILVKADGTAGEVRLQQSSGHALLDQSALQAVQNWRFRPASVNRQPVAEWYQIAIPFKLDKPVH